MSKNALWLSLSLLLVAGCGADLVPVGFQAPATADLGEDITSSVSVSVRNMGLTPVAAEECTGIFFVYFMISEDEVFDGMQELHMGMVGFEDFPVGAMQAKPVVFDEYTTLEIPYYAPTGHVYIGVFVDAHGYCSRDDPENNIGVLPIFISTP
jgi:hypothetical protein